jgi:hypothetical protein
VATTASEGAGAKWAPELTDYFRDRTVVILPDADGKGRKHALKVAAALYPVAKSVKVVDLYPERNDGHDVADWLEDDVVAVRLIKEVGSTPEWHPPADGTEATPASKDEQALIAELAALSPLDYAKRKKGAAARLGVSASDLDRLVVVARAEKKVDELDVLYGHWVVEPWPEPVDGAKLFHGLSECISRYVIMTSHQLVACVLWIVYSWLHTYEKFATHSPLLLAKSPERDSGKTTLLGTVSFLVRRGLSSVEISGPALFRSISKWAPSFIVDEADDVFEKNPDLRTVVNSGWTRGQNAIKCHHETHDPEAFSTFCPKAIGMKGENIPDTTASRAITIDMKPKKADEKVEDFDHLDNETFHNLRRQLLRWTTDNAEALAALKSGISIGFFYNRRRANWRPLLTIARLMGQEEAGRAAALAIEQQQATVDPSMGLQLLRDIRKVFRGLKAAKHGPDDRITTGGLAMALADLPERPWATYHREEPIKTRQVTALLKPYGIRPGSVKIPKTADKTCKGYLLEWFEDTFARYLPATDEDEEEGEEGSGSDRTREEAGKSAPSAKIGQIPLDFKELASGRSAASGAREISGGPGSPSQPGTPGTSLKSLADLPESNPEPRGQVPGLETPNSSTTSSRCRGFRVETPDSGPENFSNDDLPADFDPANPFADLDEDLLEDQPDTPLEAPREPPPGTVASVPFLIPEARKARLRARGYAESDLRHMSPQQALDLDQDTPSTSLTAGPCWQCGAHDGTEALVALEGRPPALLHELCVPFYLREHGLRRREREAGED